MSSNNVLSRTISSITSTKLDELSRSQQSYEKRRVAEVAKAESCSTKVEQTMALLRGLAEIHGAKIEEKDQEDGSDEYTDKRVRVEGTADEQRWGNMLQFLQLTERDPSVTDKLVADWQAELMKDLTQRSYKYSHAKLVSELITQFSKSGAEPTPKASESTTTTQEETKSELRDAEAKQRKTWEEIVFEPVEIDTEKIKSYLDDLFKSNTKTKHAYDTLKTSLKSFGESLFHGGHEMSKSQLKKAVNAIPHTTPLPAQKVALFKEISHNAIIAREVLDVVNMRLARLNEWQWPQEGVKMTSRMTLNGKYRMYMDEDILDMLLLYHVGRLWMVHLKQKLKLFFNMAWLNPSVKLTAKERRDREVYLNEKDVSHLLNNHRKSSFYDTFFMALLPDKYGSSEGNYDGSGDDDDEPDMKVAQQASAGSTKQQLLHVCLVESQVSTVLERDFAVVQSDFHWFGPSLPVPTVLTVLKYFGVPEEWADFFSKYLYMPVKMDGKLRTRERGTPVDHTVSAFMGELLLFCLDFSVHKATDGAYLYRMHDDLWIWGTQEVCEKGWASLNRFSDVMGLKLNEDKTGSVILGDQTSASLPKNGVTWGLLRLDKATGSFLVDESMVETHVHELKFQLSKCTSILSWVKVWNLYFVKYFSYHFCEPAHCLGRAHIDMVIEAYQKIERQLFENSNVTEYVLGRIKQEFKPSHEVPPGVLYLPLHYGGLDLKNPYISLMAKRATVKRNPVGLLKRSLDLVEIRYEKAKEQYYNKSDPAVGALPAQTQRFAAKVARGPLMASAPPPRPLAAQDTTLSEHNESHKVVEEVEEEAADEFMTLEEYTKDVEGTSTEMLQMYKKLLTQVQELMPALIVDTSRYSSAYERWIFEIYGPEVKKVFGTLQIIDESTIPMGVLKLEKGKMKWHN